MRLCFIIWMEESAIICNRHVSLQVAAAIFVWKSLICRSHFPALLAQGGYTYVWVHTTNSYLTRELPLVLNCGDVADGYLYKVIYENGAAVRLEFIEALAGAQ